MVFFYKTNRDLMYYSVISLFELIISKNINITTLQIYNIKLWGKIMSKSDNINNGSRCWEFFKCSDKLKDSCRAYSFDREQCWLFNNFRGGPRTSNNGDCLECQWFKNHNK
jgi:hypothetical protein